MSNYTPVSTHARARQWIDQYQDQKAQMGLNRMKVDDAITERTVKITAEGKNDPKEDDGGGGILGGSTLLIIGAAVAVAFLVMGGEEKK